MSRDQAIGVIIFIVCILVALVYLVAIAFPGIVIKLLAVKMAPFAVRFWLIAIPVVAAFILILGIGAWIGWTMATTPPPKPIEYELEEEEEEKKEAEEKKTSE